jgi:pyroglutamyl-peptidase I
MTVKTRSQKKKVPSLPQEKSLCALITGFEPFAHHLSNPSWLAVEALPQQIGACRIVKARLPVSFKSAFLELERAIDACQPDLVICTGVAENRSGISIERVAINIDDARIPDNQGDQPIDRVIDYCAPNAYFSGLPDRAIIARLAQECLPAAISDSAGTFVCNHVMFRLLHLIAERQAPIIGGFIHVPLPAETADTDATHPGTPLAAITRSLEIAIQSCVEAIPAGHWKGRRIEIRKYDPQWPESFREISGQLREGLGHLAVRIDHIGSTSVPGLAAKDIIDIQITVNALNENVLQAMNAMGYTRADPIVPDHVPPGQEGNAEEWEKWYFRAPPGQRRTNTHVRVAGRANQRYPLLFRDFLRSHPDTAEAYGRLKRRLAATIANSRMYADVKDPAVDLIYFAAETWATQTGWQC